MIQQLPPVMTPEEVAEVLRTSPQAVMRYIHNHQLAAVRIGRFVRLRADDVLDFVASRPLSARTSKKHFIQCRQSAIRNASRKESATG